MSVLASSSSVSQESRDTLLVIFGGVGILIGILVVVMLIFALQDVIITVLGWTLALGIGAGLGWLVGGAITDDQEGMIVGAVTGGLVMIGLVLYMGARNRRQMERMTPDPWGNRR